MKTKKPLLCLFLLFFIFACSNQKKETVGPAPGGPYPTLLTAQAQFLYKETADGQIPVPGPAILTLMQKTDKGWVGSTIEDPQSNVFHKAMILTEGKEKYIMTIGGMQAALKLWSFDKKSWQQTLLWSKDFGGKWNRLRDVETGDVTGDGQADIVIATHDQGVIGILIHKKDSGWEKPLELSRTPGMFVHEIEIGDVDGDGHNEFFTTPSKPNKSKGGPQPGKIVMYKWNGSGFSETVIEDFQKTHAKEILVADIDNLGRATLFSAVEAETRSDSGNTMMVQPVRIKKYIINDNKISSQTIATINDFQCRFLTAGDVTGDGKKEIIASAMKSGLWLLKKNNAGKWDLSLIDADSSGYEHATFIDDLDNDGTAEIYVASDDQHELRRYKWNSSGFSKEIIARIPDSRITWNITTGML